MDLPWFPGSRQLYPDTAAWDRIERAIRDAVASRAGLYGWTADMIDEVTQDALALLLGLRLDPASWDAFGHERFGTPAYEEFKQALLRVIGRACYKARQVHRVEVPAGAADAGEGTASTTRRRRTLPPDQSLGDYDALIAGRPDAGMDLGIDVAAALECLPEPSRTIVLQRAIRGQGWDVIAREQGLTPAAAKARYAGALSILTKILRDYA